MSGKGGLTPFPRKKPNQGGEDESRFTSALSI